MEVEKKLINIFTSFIRDLGKTYPEIKNSLYRNYGECFDEEKRLSELPELQKFIDLIYENQKLIQLKDERLFQKDIEFLKEISFQNLWDKNISGKTKETIWKYFQTFSLISINLKSSNELQDMLDSIQNDELSEEDMKDKKTLKELKKMKQLTEEVQKEIKEEEEESELEAMMGPLLNSGIGEIAKEVASSMDIQEMLGSMDGNANPMEMMAQMMNPEKMNSIFQNIGSVIDKKKESGELNDESLKKEAANMCGQMGQNPLFNNLMKQMNPGDMVNQTKEPSKEETREKLKEKIQSKQNERRKN